MKTTFLTTGLLLCVYILAVQTQTLVKTISVENSWTKAKTDAPVVLRLKDLQPGFRVRSAVVMNGNEEIPSQLDDLNGDLKADELAFVIDLPAKNKKTLTVTLSDARTDKTYPTRVFTEMLIRDAKKQKHAPTQSVTVPGTTDFYNMLHGHGPMFESELVAYRVYFNQKQTLDPYGKFTKGLEIKESSFYPNDEQLARGFGDDVLMVGNSCGIGALKGWNGTKATHIEPVAFRTERILAYGPICTIVEVEAKGWEYQGKELNMTHRYILYAGHRDLLIETFFDEPLKNEVFCTGVQNIMGNETLSDSDHKGLVGSWGRHWPVNDTVKYAKETVGIATYIPQKYVGKEVKDKDNFLYTVTAPGSDRFHHYTMFTSCKETFGYPTPEAWFAYMREWKEGLEQPVKLKIIN
ncbi:MAG: DUF4861 domain-containing protein [Bacteroides sp.]|nr:DUF4861 domain-containing protein [Bacteroides sp.]